MAVKIDIQKAFDSMDWDFIDAILHSFGFSTNFYGWIQSILHSARVSILINGTPKCYFSCSRGVRQGGQGAFYARFVEIDALEQLASL